MQMKIRKLPRAGANVAAGMEIPKIFAEKMKSKQLLSAAHVSKNKTPTFSNLCTVLNRYNIS